MRLDKLDRAAGADLNLKNKQGFTALIRAADRGFTHLVQQLLDKGADPNVTDSRGETALTVAGEKGDVDIVEMLKAKGAQRTDIHVIPKPAPESPMLPARVWALAVPALYTQCAGVNTKILGCGQGQDARKKMLERDWHITDKATLMQTIDQLLITGHRASLQKEGATLAALSDADFAQLTSTHPDKAVSMQTARTAYAKWKDHLGLAWDLCRAANVVNAGYSAKYLTEDEAWKLLMRIARPVQTGFSSWHEMNDNFLDARAIWANGRDRQMEACSQVLLNPNDPNSPWNLNPWSTDLSVN